MSSEPRTAGPRSVVRSAILPYEHRIQVADRPHDVIEFRVVSRLGEAGLKLVRG